MPFNAVTLLLCVAIRYISGSTQPFYGVSIGPLSTLSHQVSGDVYIVDETRIRIRNLVYDGEGPAAYFWAGRRGVSGSSPDRLGVLIPDENGNESKLGRYSNADIVLTLPDSLSVRDVIWLSIWCERFNVNFGDVRFPSSVQVPRQAVVGQFSSAAERLSSGNVTVVDVRTIKVDSFTSNSPQSDIYFVGVYTNASASIVKLDHPDAPSADFDEASQLDVNLLVPEPNTIHDFQALGVHSFRNNRTLARIALSTTLLVPPYFPREGSADITEAPSSGAAPYIGHSPISTLFLMSAVSILSMLWWWCINSTSSLSIRSTGQQQSRNIR